MAAIFSYSSFSGFATEDVPTKHSASSSRLPASRKMELEIPTLSDPGSSCQEKA